MRQHTQKENSRKDVAIKINKRIYENSLMKFAWYRCCVISFDSSLKIIFCVSGLNHFVEENKSCEKNEFTSKTWQWIWAKIKVEKFSFECSSWILNRIAFETLNLQARKFFSSSRIALKKRKKIEFVVIKVSCTFVDITLRWQQTCTRPVYCRLFLLCDAIKLTWSFRVVSAVENNKRVESSWTIEQFSSRCHAP